MPSSPPAPGRAPRRRRAVGLLSAAAAALAAGVAAPPAMAHHRPSPPFSLNPFISAGEGPRGGTVLTVRIYAGISGYSLICGECSGRSEEQKARNLDGRLHVVLVDAPRCPARPPSVGGNGVLRIFMARNGHPWRPVVHGYQELATRLRPGPGWEGEYVVCAWFEYEGFTGGAVTGPYTERLSSGEPDRVTVRRPARRTLTGLAVTATQLEINDRISRAALHRAESIAARLEGRQEPERPAPRPVSLSAAQLLQTQRVAQDAIRRAAALEARLDGRPAPEAASGGGRGDRVTLTPRQILINQRISQAAIFRLNLLQARLDP